MQLPAWLLRLFPAKSLGRRGEDAAARYLRKLGYKIVARGDRATLGELDIVAVDDRTIVFVEVKTRRSQESGHPSDAVDLAKQRRISRLALGYLRRHELLDYPARFDVVAVTWPEKVKQPAIEHFKHAFPATGTGGMYG